MQNNLIRLQVFLSRNGVCSRRKALDLVLGGRVSVNGRRVAEPSAPVDPLQDKICVDDKIVAAKAYTYILLNKPQGCVTTRADRFAEKTVFDCLPERFRHLVPVGRLDKDTEGLLLLTNDGDLTHQLTHPKFSAQKTYLVRVAGSLDPGQRQRAEQGMWVEGYKTRPAKIKDVHYGNGQTQFLMTIHEGRKRQIRIMFGQMDRKVVFLKRVSQGPLRLGDLKAGCWRELSNKEIIALKGLR